ncbi:MAG: hypothetical protein JO020_30015 [Chloroflexi bacterium]|nr:hypothetical protein [Chloroflexota bacterium]
MSSCERPSSSAWCYPASSLRPRLGRPLRAPRSGARMFSSHLQHLPPRQRAALVLREVLGFRRAEVAEMLETSGASVKGALQRARATLDARLGATDRDLVPLPGSERERDVVGRFIAAVEQGDTPGLIELLSDDATTVRVPGCRADREIHRSRTRGPSRRQPPAGPDSRQRPAGLWVLSAGSPRTGGPRLRDHGSHAA